MPRRVHAQPLFSFPRALAFSGISFYSIIEFFVIIIFLNILRQGLAMHPSNPPAIASPVLRLVVLATHAMLSQDS